MRTDFFSKNVVITGGSRGLGRTIATAFVKAGANVLIAARNKAEIEATGRALQAMARPSQKVEARALDLGVRGAARELLAGAWASPDVLINNAGIQGPVGSLWTNDPGEWEALFQIGLFAPVALMRAVIPGMLERGWGRIINVSGGGSTAPRPGFSAYAAAKTGLVRATETVADELTGTGVTVNAIAPGAMNTKMLQGIRELGAEIAGRKEIEAAERLAKSNEPPGVKAAELCVFLASQASSQITGRLIAALWDPWDRFEELGPQIAGTDLFTLRRITPRDRGLSWEDEK